MCDPWKLSEEPSDSLSNDDLAAAIPVVVVE